MLFYMVGNAHFSHYIPITTFVKIFITGSALAIYTPLQSYNFRYEVDKLAQKFKVE